MDREAFVVDLTVVRRDERGIPMVLRGDDNSISACDRIREDDADLSKWKPSHHIYCPVVRTREPRVVAILESYRAVVSHISHMFLLSLNRRKRRPGNHGARAGRSSMHLLPAQQSLCPDP